MATSKAKRTQNPLFLHTPLPWTEASGNLFDALSLPVLMLTPSSPAPLSEVAKRVNVHDELADFIRNLDQWDKAVKANNGIGLADHIRTKLDSALKALT